MTAVEALKAARALIEDPKRWTQKLAARAADGRMVGCEAGEATQWCAVGAAIRFDAQCPRLDAAAKLLGCSLGYPDSLRPTAAVNDGKSFLPDGSTGHPAVLKIYDKAIELAEAEASK